MEPFLGEIKLFSGTYAPENWAFCAGQHLAIADNPTLFAVISNTYGGDGRVSFGLPDLRGRVALGVGQGPGLNSVQPGQIGGRESVELSIENLPSHSHVANATTEPDYDFVTLGKSDGLRSVPQAGDIPSASSASSTSVNIYGPDDNNTAPGQAINRPNVRVTISDTGGSEPYDNHQPYLGLNYIICISGMFPPRS